MDSNDQLLGLCFAGRLPRFRLLASAQIDASKMRLGLVFQTSLHDQDFDELNSIEIAGE